MAAQISDKLNSPLLVLLNIYETLERKWHISSDRFHHVWTILNDNMKKSLSELKEVSVQLEKMRESENKLLEATKLLNEPQILNNEGDDAKIQ